MLEGKSEILRGALDLMALKTLATTSPLHGYGIARRIEQIREEALPIDQDTIYAAFDGGGKLGAHLRCNWRLLEMAEWG